MKASGLSVFQSPLMCCVLGVCVLAVPFGSPRAVAAPPSEGAPGSYFEMTLDELMSEQVRIGSLTELSLSEAPVSVTTITRRQIELTPARSVVDLLEIYVPGAQALAHNTPRLGMRGVIIDRNYKFLLLVNGRNVNNKSALGATVEIHNWDMNDIERIEVIRGPGSVTYGPGAIAGVVNIVTRTGEDMQGWRTGVAGDVEYRSSGAYVQYGHLGEAVDLFFHASVWNIDGQLDPEYFGVDKTGTFGYQGDDWKKAESPYAYRGDVEHPQIKLHLDLGYADTWRFWARYSGYTHPRRDSLEDFADGRFPAGFIRRHFLAAVLENELELSTGTTLRTELSYDSEHTLMVQHDPAAPAGTNHDEGLFKYDPAGTGVDRGHLKYNTAEHELLLRMVAEHTFGQRLDLALGGSISYEWLAESFFWNTTTAHDWIAANVGNRPDVQEAIGKGFDTWTFSAFGEGNIHLHPKLDLLVSGRVDKNQWSKTLFSPRVGAISRLDERNVLRATAQRSVRMNTLVELFTDDYHGRESDPETLDSVELLYSWLPADHVGVNASAFANRLEALGWDGDKTAPLGDAEYAGVELEVTCQTRQCRAGLSHAVTQLIDFESKVPDDKPQGISYSDYDITTAGGLVLDDEGDSFANYPEHVTKAYLTCEGLPWRLACHVDAALFWAYPGAKDSVEMYEDAYAGGDAKMNALSKRLDQEDFAESNILLNASVQKAVDIAGMEGRITLFAANLLEFRRYQYVSGERDEYPWILRWVEEPRTFGAKLDLRF